MNGRPSAREEDPMSPQPIHSSVSPLRRRMLEDMAMRGLREATQRIVAIVRIRCIPVHVLNIDDSHIGDVDVAHVVRAAWIMRTIDFAPAERKPAHGWCGPGL